MNKFYMNGKLIHKASDHNNKRCEVEKWVFLPHSDFERLKADLLNITQKQTENAIKRLKETKRIHREGNAHNGKWIAN